MFKITFLIILFLFCGILSNAQYIQQGNKLIGTGVVPNSSQGQSVAVSSDGNTAIIGAPKDANGIGASWVFIRSAGIWTQQTKLVATDAIDASAQGQCVAISSDGNTAIVGGNFDNGGIGASWIFVRSGGVWTQQAKLVATDASGGSQQGYSVSLSSDGNTAVVGGYTDNDGIGASWIFIRSGGVWTQQAKLVATDAIGNANQGQAVCISADGNTTIIGGRADNNNMGASWIFTRSGNVWSQQAKLLGKDVTDGAQFGYAVSLSADGKTALAGAPNNNSMSGASWVFIYLNGVWTEQNILLAYDNNSSNQGKSVSLSSDGNIAVIGMSSGSYLSGADGGAWIFTRSNGDWTQKTKILGLDSVGDPFEGQSVCLSSDGKTILMGGPKDNNSNGGSWAFTPSGDTWIQQGSKLVGTGGIGAAQQGYTVSLSADGNTLLESGVEDNGGIGAAWIFTRSNNVWSQQKKLLPSNYIANPRAPLIGYGLSISPDGNTALLGGFFDNNSLGAAWVFTRSDGVWTQQEKLLANDATGFPSQGRSVALSYHGDTAIVSGEHNGKNNEGAAWIFTRSGTIWTQRAKLTANNTIGSSNFGRSVHISYDGNTAIAGGYHDNNSIGAAWIFSRADTGWVQQAKLTGNDIVGAARMGISVSLSADGNTAIVGGYQDNNSIGAAWVFTRTAGIWTQQGSKLVPNDVNGEASFGLSVSLSANGDTAMIGGYNDSSSVGASWIFTRSGGIWKQQGSKLVGTGSVGAGQQGSSVYLSADGNTAISGGGFDNYGQGATWVFVNTSANTNHWTGSVSDVWENSANWSLGIVPDATTIVYIESGKLNYPVINSIATCKAIYTSPGVSIKINTGFKLNVVGAN
ncbi:FG-GAP repeat protein [Ferruginibacter albus]|uniref:FG-GAP repeat protein n=1 Tax=Ferruginibacter albus TaxID=2875540 RepID=UPI001CC63C2F|nr:FG-GAP repeat protein [Ferruginibacter albus]UAY53158.1 FG-GAP repeat protein [Ferruginibacter albus]